MKKFLETAGLALLLQGVGGIVHHRLGWFRFWVVLPRLGFLDGYEIFAGVVLAVLGVAVIIASDSVKA
ncbi:hypothetical protein [Wenjunlia tyrosinilytica]|uniref:Uncharacterized protein n=1 Tax=Wenjunlia tyrosinilytica TaxID=1544741 RepID=A0A917ZND1_9ACTN|nr:hypothetical protein [Wenjunlia tyrosinilytica]GGO86772.1 hypothetical protein GCM10012280_23690 [Wenjunlia tyrosinilytica]